MDFQGTMENMFKELQETMHRQVKEGLMTMCHQVEIINKEIEIIKKRINGNHEDEKYNN